MLGSGHLIIRVIRLIRVLIIHQHRHEQHRDFLALVERVVGLDGDGTARVGEVDGHRRLDDARELVYQAVGLHAQRHVLSAGVVDADAVVRLRREVEVLAVERHALAAADFQLQESAAVRGEVRHVAHRLQQGLAVGLQLVGCVLRNHAHVVGVLALDL